MDGQVPHPLDRLLDEVIRDEGGACTAADARADIVAGMEEIQVDMAARGEAEVSFCFYNIAGGVAVFAVVGKSLEVYVVPCPKAYEWELVNRFDRLARTDVDNYRARLRDRYGKEQPDLLIRPELAAEWLYPDGVGTAEEEGVPEMAGTPLDEMVESPAAYEETEAAEPEVGGDQYLEQMMDAIRAAGGGKGRRPFRPTDLG
jgi:hypothetical protein